MSFSAKYGPASPWDIHGPLPPGLLVEPDEFELTSPAPPLPKPAKSAAPAPPAEPPLRKAGEILADLEIAATYIRTPAEAHSAMNDLLLEKTLGLDIETLPLPAFTQHRDAGLNPHTSRIRTIQFFNGKQQSFVFDLHTVDLALLSPLFEKRLVAHNAGFECKFLRHVGISPRWFDCTRLMAAVLNLGPSCRLQWLAEQLLNLKIDKSLQISDWTAPELSDEQIAYAALDSVLPIHIGRKLWVDLRAKALVRTYDLQLTALTAVAGMELAGMYFDLAGHAVLEEEWQSLQATAEAEVRQHVGPDLNIDSPPQLGVYLSGVLPAEQLNAWPRTPGGQLSTGDDVLSRFPEIELVRPLLEYRKFAKLVGTYGESLRAYVCPATKRIHASYLLSGAASGRMACRRPNLQNCLRDPRFRALFAAPAGRMLVVADYSQIELRAIAELSRDEVMLRAFREGRDLHRQTASIIAGIREAEITKEQRQAAKAVNFGLSFGMKERGLAEYARTAYGVEMSPDEASKARAQFFAAYEGLACWQRKQIRQARQDREVRTPGGRIRRFQPDEDYRIPTEALNHPVQGAAAECLVIALAGLTRSLQETTAVIVNCVHDEIVCECDLADADLVKELLEIAMVKGFQSTFPESSIVGLVEASSGVDWAACK